MSSAIASSYEDTLRSMRTGKTEASPLSSLKSLMTWGRPDAVLPVAGRVPEQSTGGSSVLSWPPWASTTSSRPPFYDTFGLTIVQRYMAFGGCILGAVLMFLLVRRYIFATGLANNGAALCRPLFISLLLF